MYVFRVLKHKLWMGFVNVISRLMKNPRPMVVVGKESAIGLCKLIAGRNLKHILIVTDHDLVQLGLHGSCVETLESAGLKVTIYNNIAPNPTLEQMEEGVKVGVQSGCDAVLALGGGSPMDAGKIIAARLTNPISIQAMEGAFKVKNPPLPIFAIPTTAGTGSEVTIAAVVTNTQEQRKYTVADTKLVPLATALDPVLMTGLPPKITAATGIDALTHAVEAFIATRATDEVKTNARIAIKLIFENLPKAYSQGDDLAAREAMAVASYHAGIAIADAGVGYVHAIAHQLGGIYLVPHGLANAVILPYVLDHAVDKVTAELAELARLIDIDSDGKNERDLANAFIVAVRNLNQELSLPINIPEIQQKDIPAITARAITEAFDFFAVPKYLSHRDGEKMLIQIASK